MNKTFINAFFTLLSVVFCLPSGYTQTMAGFENFNLKPGEYLNNASPETGFRSGSIELPNFYDAEFNYWAGWAVSADTNTITPGFLNQYSSISGAGALGTSTYCIGYIYDPIIVRLQPNSIGKPMIGMYINNSTYTYLSMRDGDSFAKKFGGETGLDPDFLLLTIKKYSGGAIDDDSINIYLADYRFPQSKRDYILSDWTYIDLTKLGEVDSLELRMTSSDVGIFGMNTPAYVCIDQVSTDNLLSASSLNRRGTELIIGPNPVNETLYIDVPFKSICSISSIQGVQQWSRKLETGQHQVAVSEWPKGIYVVTLDGGHAIKIIVQ
ncbi:MAG: DUF4465 domain-containing protein [Saprospiraceae bacterium]|nr:DUF4465 domain-containing protein [Saprospiraceae bacterium]